MKDLYRILGLQKDASHQQIKKAYRSLAMDAHPDKGGSAERMALLNEAYATLSDPIKRQNFNHTWGIFQENNFDSAEDQSIGNITSPSIMPYSQSFREKHQSLATKFRYAPLNLEPSHNQFKKGETHLYAWETENQIAQHDIELFSYLQSKNSEINSGIAIISFSKEKLTTYRAIILFKEYLAGAYYGDNLSNLIKYFQSELDSLKKQYSGKVELECIEGIFEIMSATLVDSSVNKGLIYSIKKITDFGKKCDDHAFSYFAPLLYNKYFKALFLQALYQYWQSCDDLFRDPEIEKWNGKAETQDLFDVLKIRLSHSDHHNHSLISLIQFIKILINYENINVETTSKSGKSCEYRENAFHLLDWLPSFMEGGNRQITINALIQIGTLFQKASQLEENYEIKMADEQLALKMYLMSIGTANHSAPDIELYANMHCLRYISRFQYKSHNLYEIINLLQKRTHKISDIFPFFEPQKANVTFMTQREGSIFLIRRLLNVLMKIVENNKFSQVPIEINQSNVDILYYAYEGCLKNWFEEEFNPNSEKKIKLQLMKELLSEQNWGFLDVTQNLSSPWIMVERDEHGWLKSDKLLTNTNSEMFEIFRSVEGAEINHKTGEVVIFLNQWNVDYPDYEKAFTLFDVQEMLGKKINGAIFSLDPVDPDMPYHPFNHMRFSPARLDGTEFLHTMLLTDYILKFLTTKQEVQGNYPYSQRSINSMIEKFPNHLKDIIHNFHSEKHAESLHRFWIEAQELDAYISDEQSQDVTRFSFGDVRMVVRKHQMQRNIDGELKDVSIENEGWPIYVLTSTQMEDLQKGDRVIREQCLIFILNTNQVYIWGNHKIQSEHRPIGAYDMMMELYKQKREDFGKIIHTTSNEILLYKLIKEVTMLTNVPHRYSSEYVFAMEFTLHYDEIAQYIPEFRRLKELSKMASLSNILSNIQEANRERIALINQSIESRFSSSLNQNINIDDVSIFNNRNIFSQFRKWRSEISLENILNKRRIALSEMRAKLSQALIVSEADINKANSDQYWSPFRSFSFRRLLTKGRWMASREELTQKIKEARLEQCRAELHRAFSPMLSKILLNDGSYNSRISSLITSFLRGDVEPLVTILGNDDYLSCLKEIKKQFPLSSIELIDLGLKGSGDAIHKIILTESRPKLVKEKARKEKLDLSFTKIGLGQDMTESKDKEKCHWVPASVRHELTEEGLGGSRSLYFVYGGVNIQPRMNIIRDQKINQYGSVAGGRQTGSRATRYNATDLNQGRGRTIPPGDRKEILRNERIYQTPHAQVPRSASSQTKGRAGELAAATTLRRAGYDILPSKLPGNKGFDHVAVLRDAHGAVQEVVIVESKYSHKGEFSLGNTATKGKQMSEVWIEKTLNDMRRSSEPDIRATAEILDVNYDKWVLRGNVLDSSGKNSWKKPTRIVNDQQKTQNQSRAPPKSP